MKILVTGATGFIGNYVINELLKGDYEIIATARSNKKDIYSTWLYKVTYFSANLNEDKKDWFSFFNEPDKLIHLAWENLPNYKELFHFERNLPNNYLFLKNLIENGLGDITVTGTCFEYGFQEGELSEAQISVPNNPYGIAKNTLRIFIEELQKKINFKLKWIRIFYPYGEGQSPNSVLSQLEAVLERKEKVFNMSGGEQLRDYLPVEKVAEYIVKISMQDKIGGIINCCSGEPISIRKLVEDYLKKNQKDIELNLGYYPYPDYEPMAFWGDTTKLNKAVKLSKCS